MQYCAEKTAQGNLSFMRKVPIQIRISNMYEFVSIYFSQSYKMYFFVSFNHGLFFLFMFFQIWICRLRFTYDILRHFNQPSLFRMSAAFLSCLTTGSNVWINPLTFNIGNTFQNNFPIRLHFVSVGNKNFQDIFAVSSKAFRLNSWSWQQIFSLCRSFWLRYPSENLLSLPGVFVVVRSLLAALRT
jgi:hypothetical protein